MRPHWRGRLHTYAAFATIPLGIWLILSANGVADRIAVGLYALSLHGVFAISSSYHRLTKTEESQAFMRKLDHSMIYVLIAGTYTPMCVIGLREDNGPLYMWIVWSASAIGILLTVFGKMFRTAMGMYIAIGWIAVWIIPHIHGVVGWWPVLLYLAGGAVYTTGAILFFTKRPRLAPDHFGFHELWHVNTVVAAALHFGATMLVVEKMS